MSERVIFRKDKSDGEIEKKPTQMTPMKHIEPLLTQIQTIGASKPLESPARHQERPQTALGEAYEYHTRRAAFCQRCAADYLQQGDQKFADAYLADVEFHTRLATACKEADER